MDQLGGAGRSAARQIVHFRQENRKAAPNRVARDAASVDAAANDENVEYFFLHHGKP